MIVRALTWKTKDGESHALVDTNLPGNVVSMHALLVKTFPSSNAQLGEYELVPVKRDTVPCPKPVCSICRGSENVVIADTVEPCVCAFAESGVA